MATIGLDKLYYAKITENDNGDETYGTPTQLAKAMTAELSVELAEATLYADDGAAEVVPAGPCVTVRFRGSHQEAPEQYRRIMAWLRARGLRPARPSREITLIDDGLTRDPAQFVTEIAIPVEHDGRGEAHP